MACRNKKSSEEIQSVFQETQIIEKVENIEEWDNISKSTEIGNKRYLNGLLVGMYAVNTEGRESPRPWFLPSRS